MHGDIGAGIGTQPYHGLEILYYSLYQENSFDYDLQGECTPRQGWSHAHRLHRMYSSKEKGWTKKQTAERHAEICAQLVAYGDSEEYDAVVVAAGFDHCIGEWVGGSSKANQDKLWTEAQMEALGSAVHQCASKSRVLKFPVSVLEGGYEKDTMLNILPAYALCSAGGSARGV
jgi:acetoin utilization deacetylase AcuC-like enzyme